jgi:hypothetical protein
MASRLYRLLAGRIGRGCERAESRHRFQDFVNATAQGKMSESDIVVRYQKRAHNPCSSRPASIRQRRSSTGWGAGGCASRHLKIGSICHLIFVRIPQVGDADVAIGPPIPSAEMGTDAMPARSGIGIIAIVQDHRLDVTVDCLDRIVIGAGFGQADPVESQGPHHPPRLPRFARMRPVLVQGGGIAPVPAIMRHLESAGLPL